MPQVRQQITQNRIVLPIVILPSEDSGRFEMVEARALVDTGASVSGIAGGHARSLGLHGRGKRPILGVRGIEQVERYIFRFGFVADHPTPFVLAGDIFGIEFAATENFDALIGMDILRRGELRLTRTGSFTFDFD